VVEAGAAALAEVVVVRVVVLATLGVALVVDSAQTSHSPWWWVPVQTTPLTQSPPKPLTRDFVARVREVCQSPN
jgi:hypothetical protein